MDIENIAEEHSIKDLGRVSPAYECGFTQGASYQQKIDIEKAIQWLNKNLSRCVECYIDDVVTTRLKEDVLEDFEKAMEE